MRLVVVVLLLTASLSPALQAQCGGLTFTGPSTLGIIDSSDITEASGIAASWRNPGIFWTHNDGAREKIFALNNAGHLVATFRLGKSVDDVEDIAVGPGPDPSLSYLYVGDIGSNSADRDEVQILRVAEPAVSANGGTLDFQNVEVFHLKYPRGKFDAEALLLDPVQRALFIATKEDNGAHLFRLSLDALTTVGKSMLEEVAQLEFSKISGAAISKDGSLIAFRREDQAHLWLRTSGQDVVDALRGSGMPLPVVGPPNEPNGEGITFLPDNSGYVTVSEGKSQPLDAFGIQAGRGQPAFVGGPLLSSGGVEIRAIACSGSRVSLLRSVDLKNWTAVATYASSGDVHSFLVDNPAGSSFYRLLSE